MTAQVIACGVFWLISGSSIIFLMIMVINCSNLGLIFNLKMKEGI